jgi:hypothetical protein
MVGVVAAYINTDHPPAPLLLATWHTLQQNCLSDFWSRRWNLPAAYTLRSLVFDPIIEGRAVKADKGRLLND